jgi:crotonobetainyl-CoA:carnitine CoA-transferase CaiB-like acyl-CoA transferase
VGCTGGLVNNIGEALADPQVQLRHMVVEIGHPVGGRYKTTGNPIKMGFQDSLRPPPMLSQHTEEVLGARLGYSSRDIQSLREARAS